MPPKKQPENNHPRAVAKREREAQQAAMSKAASAKAAEDAKWADTPNRKEQKAAERSQDKMQKQQELLDKRAAKKALQAEEDVLMAKVKLDGAAKKNLLELGEYKGTGQITTSAGKITQHELMLRKEKEKQLQEKQAELDRLKSEKILTNDYGLVENTNHLNKVAYQEDVDKYGAGNVVDARGVENAIKGMSLLSIDPAELKADRFPEKRRKQAYKEFEKKRLPEMRLDYPELKLSQLREKIFKEFQTSPENPVNQQ